MPEAQQPFADLTPVSPGYFGTMQIPVLQGRDFAERDDAKAPQVMIVNRAFAEKFFPGENVIGKKLKPGAGNGFPEVRPGAKSWAWWETSGCRRPQREMRPAMYLPAAQMNTLVLPVHGGAHVGRSAQPGAHHAPVGLFA